MKLSIITINYNKSLLTLNCINSLYEHYSSEFTNNIFELFVIDNASSNSDLNKLEIALSKNKYVNLKLIKSSNNLGFSKGCNMGATKSKGEYLLFLNNDTKVIDNGILNMVSFLEVKDEVAVLGGKLMNLDKSEQVSVGKFYTLINAISLLLGLQRLSFVRKNPVEACEVDWVKGGSLMVRRNVFETLGGFDENLFMYIEDMEFCYRAKKIGFKIYFYPHVTIEHIDQGSSNRTFAIVNIYKNLLYFYKKHRTRYEYILLKSILTIKAVILIEAGKITRNDYLIKTYEKALKVA